MIQCRLPDGESVWFNPEYIVAIARAMRPVSLEKVTEIRTMDGMTITVTEMPAVILRMIKESKR